MKPKFPQVVMMCAFSRSHSFTKVACFYFLFSIVLFAESECDSVETTLTIQKRTCSGEQLSNKMEGTRVIYDMEHSNLPVVDACLPTLVRGQTFFFYLDKSSCSGLSCALT